MQINKILQGKILLILNKIKALQKKRNKMKIKCIILVTIKDMIQIVKIDFFKDLKIFSINDDFYI
jgi:hypothetical protein